jgi:glyoxylase-like metal-dependent hydrolase (beta-lactamase superfamily II)
MYIQNLQLGALETNCWIVAPDALGECAVIDPAGDYHLLDDALAGFRVSAILLTHAHFDHIGAAEQLIAATGAPLMAHAEVGVGGEESRHSGTLGELLGFDEPPLPRVDRVLGAGDLVEIGGLRLEVLETPGHTAGSICFFAEDPDGGAPHLFAGDTLFAGSVGRTDLPGGDSRALAHSIAAVLAPLPGETIVHPGHGPDTTIARERRLNPFFPRA